MATGEFFRGGNSLRPSPREVKIDPRTGLLSTKRGVSVSSHPGGLDRFGGAYRVTNVPAEVTIVQIGANPQHHEIVPTHAMTLAEYEHALGKIVLVPVSTGTN
jgi:hypothetical protein